MSGLGNAPDTFQWVIDVILPTTRWKYALVYLDDIVIFSQAPKDHVKHARSALCLRKNAEVTIKLKKFAFFTDVIDYLAHVTNHEKIEVENHTAGDISKLQLRTTVTELRSFLGLYNVFRRFLPNFAKSASTLSKQLRKLRMK